MAAQKYEQRPEDNGKYGALVDNDTVKGAVQRYEFEVQAGLQLIQEFRAISPYLMDSLSEKELYSRCILKLVFSDCDRYKSTLDENEFIRRVRLKYWKALFDNNDFCGLLTSNLRSDYRANVRKLADYDFSLYNIYTLRLEMSQSMVKGVEETIIALFDELSHKHYWDKDTSQNIHYYNGWKTNSAYKINKKVIIPLNGFRDLAYSWGGQDIDDYKVIQKLGDIEKVFNYLDGGITEEVDIVRALKKAQAHGITQKIPLKYFRVTFYKKGTCHIEFDNLELLKKFNIFGSRKKGWLPPSYGKAKYSDLSQAEKEVVDSFDGGEVEYNKMMLNCDYYLFDANKMPLLSEHTA
jgi:hypothetical protein